MLYIFKLQIVVIMAKLRRSQSIRFTAKNAIVVDSSGFYAWFRNGFRIETHFYFIWGEDNPMDIQLKEVFFSVLVEHPVRPAQRRIVLPSQILHLLFCF